MTFPTFKATSSVEYNLNFKHETRTKLDASFSALKSSDETFDARLFFRLLSGANYVE